MPQDLLGVEGSVQRAVWNSASGQPDCTLLDGLDSEQSTTTVAAGCWRTFRPSGRTSGECAPVLQYQRADCDGFGYEEARVLQGEEEKEQS